MNEVYVFPSGPKFSGQTSVADGRNAISLPMPIGLSGTSVWRALVPYLTFYRKAYNFREHNVTISVALGVSYLLRVLPLAYIFKQRIEIEIHTGPSWPISGISRFLLKQLAMRVAVVKLLGPNPEIECLFSESSIFFFKNYYQCCDGQEATKPAKHSRKYKLGFLALNIESKGIYQFEKLLTDLSERGVQNYRAIAAGPFHKSRACSSKHNESRFKETINQLSLLNCDYKCRVEANEKKSFFEDINIFVFLSRFAGEAQPMVLLEAQYYGCEIVALDIGYVQHMDLSNCKVFDSEQSISEYLEGRLNESYRHG